MLNRLAKLLFAGVVSIGFVSAQSVITPNGTKKVTSENKSEKSETEIIKNKNEIPEIAQLFADNVNLKDSKKISNFATAINESLGYKTVSEEDLMYPALDLYGKASWHSGHVNPFAGGISANVPDSFAIDLSQFSYPLDKLQRITSRYGYRRRFRRMHYGIDVKLQVGDTIRAVFDGRVRMVEYDRRGYGKYVVIRHVNGLETVYAHCSRHLVKRDQIVRAGDPIALGGNTGRSTGSHLHFETRFMGQPINPEHLIDFNTGIPKNEYYMYVKSGGNNRNTHTSIAKRSGAPNGSGVVLHKIRSGDTLSGIASRYGMSVSKLCQINGISRNTTLRVGRTLRVTDSNNKISSKTTANQSGTTVHKIRRGDTLSAIANRYGTSVTKLCEINGISTRTTLRVGNTIRVS